MNYGETLVEWYLRLNGFFLIRNFVLHYTGEEGTADWDLLAVRFPYVYEMVGGQDKDWDNPRFEHWGFTLSEQIIGLMVEVKTGQLNTEAISKIAQDNFSGQRIQRALERMGMFNTQQVAHMKKGLQTQKVFSLSDLPYHIGKVVVVRETVMRQAAFHKHLSNVALTISLEEVNKFITDRMDRTRKQADRMSFSNELIQYIAWSKGLE